jgi:hypothetical protein
MSAPAMFTAADVRALASTNGHAQPTLVGASTPDTGELLAAVKRFIARYVVLPGEDEATALALWVLHTWALSAAHATPYLIVQSAEKRSGKSRLLETLELVVNSPWAVISASESALFRKIDQDKPTLLLDEVDAIFGSSTERTEPLRAIVNAGNRPGSAVARCVGEGARQRVEDFEVYCPKVLAGIDTGRLPDTIRDRGIEIRMKRKTDAEPVERFRRRLADPQAAPLREQSQAWAQDHAATLHDAEPDLPAALNDRAAEAWESLFAIADLAAGGWPERARAAALALTADEADEGTHGTRLLAALRAVIGEREAVGTADALEALNHDDELPFGAWRDGRGLDARTLAKLLRPYGVKPQTVRIGDETPKGYRRDALSEAWRRYLPSGPAEPVVADVADVPPTAEEKTDLVAAREPDLDARADALRERYVHAAQATCGCERPLVVRDGDDDERCARCGKAAR